MEYTNKECMNVYYIYTGTYQWSLLINHIQQNKTISGDYYSVSPIAIKHKVELFCMNKREYTILNNSVFGDVIYSEVGATMVGSIIQTHNGNSFYKGEEKSYFKFGGSTVIMLFEKNRIKIDEDLLNNTQNGLETAVLMGETLGKGVVLVNDKITK